MPIYEYECPKHGPYEWYYKTTTEKEITFCFVRGCHEKIERIHSLCAMQPDNMWSGVSNEQGYFTSKKQYLSNLKDKNLVRVERGLTEDVKKKAKNRLPEQLKKNEKNLEKFLGKELAGM